MLLFPTFVQQSVQIGNKGNTEYHSHVTTIARSINVFNDPQRMVKLSKITSNGTICRYTYSLTSMLKPILNYNQHRMESTQNSTLPFGLALPDIK